MKPGESRAIGKRLREIAAELSQLATKLKVEEGGEEVPEWFKKAAPKGSSKKKLSALCKSLSGLSGNDLDAIRGNLKEKLKGQKG